MHGNGTWKHADREIPLCAILFGVCIFADEAPPEFSCAEDPCKFGAAAEAAAAAETLYCTHSIWKADKRTDRLKEGGGADERKRTQEGRRREGGRREGMAGILNSISPLSPPPPSLLTPLSPSSPLLPIPTIGLGSHRFIKQRLYSPLKDADGARRPSHPPRPPFPPRPFNLDCGCPKEWRFLFDCWTPQQGLRV